MKFPHHTRIHAQESSEFVNIPIMCQVSSLGDISCEKTIDDIVQFIMLYCELLLRTCKITNQNG